MQAEVLSVGTELLLGQTVNTDTTIVAKALSALGIDLLYAAVVGDNVGRLEKAVYDALDRSDILITTGGRSGAARCKQYPRYPPASLRRR